MVMDYEHTQIGYLFITVLLAVALYLGFILRAETEPIVNVVLLLIILIMASFATLKVTINEDDLKIKFGYGIFRKRFPLKEIASVKTEKNHWYYGWGIRFWPQRRMWIFNVSGFDAVEIKMKNGRIYRIGTDDPENLESAIKRAIQWRGIEH